LQAKPQSSPGLDGGLAKPSRAGWLRKAQVCPGTTATELVTTTLLKDPVALEGWRASVLMGDFARVEDHAHAVVFLASDRARHITGQLISVDGGQSLNWLHGTKY
jgi:NAD(P)-dependent dehydrogenase (short-subunit alcohol dehydrogenase family)